MDNTLLKTLSLFIICIIIFPFMFGHNVSAGDLDDYYTDSTSGWTLKDSKSHRGSKGNLYHYSSTSVKSSYASDFSSAVSLGGGYISMSETTSSEYGIITTENNESSNAVATTGGLTYTSSTGHYNDSFLITINKAKYDDKSANLKALALAHEIGHVYGLSHFDDSTKLMNPSLVSAMTVSSSDKYGMTVCTHSHTHSSAFSYNSYSNLRHKKRCTTCKAYTLESHSWDSSGTVCTDCGYTKS